MSRLFKEPLFHFALIGLALFALYGAIGGTTDEVADQPERRILIDERVVQRLTDGFEGVWRRPPTDEELEGLIESHITEEVLVREALLLGLDVGDSVVRQRLRLKMDFLLEGGASSLSPSDEDLTTYMAENADRFQQPASVAFSQVYLGENATDAEALELVDALNAGGDPAEMGQRSLLPQRIPLSPAQSVDGTFGNGVFETLSQAPDGEWFGPVQSGYGTHVVRIDARQDAVMPDLQKVRSAVEQTWRADKAQEIRDARVAELTKSYEIERQGSDDG